MNLSYNTYLDRKTQILAKKMCHKMNPVMAIFKYKRNEATMYRPKKVRQLIKAKYLVLYCTGLSPFNFTLIRFLL